MRSLGVKWLLGAALASAAMVSVTSAKADDAPAKPAGENAVEPKKDAKDDQPEDPIFRLGVDMVFGSASTPVVTGVVQPGTTNGILGITDPPTPHRITSYSFLLEGGVKLTEGFGVNVRLPIVGGTLLADPTRSDAGIGAIELSADGKLKLADNLALKLSLGISLPTAQGTQLPTAAQIAAGSEIQQGAIDQSNYDRFSVMRAASIARGYEDDELFQPQHLGINPKIALVVGTEGKWRIEPWVKLDNLIAVNSNYSFIDELVFGANLGVNLVPELEAVVRVWGNVPITGADYSSAVAVVEPQLRLHLGPVSPYVGGILPIAGPITSPYDFGIRVGLSASF